MASRQGAGTWVVNAGRVRLPARPRGTAGLPTHNFLPGSPDVSAFPRARGWHRPGARSMRRPPRRCGWVTPAAGPNCAIAVAEYLARARGRAGIGRHRGHLRGHPARGRDLARMFGRRAGRSRVEAYGLFIFRECIEAAALDDADRLRREGRDVARSGRRRHPGGAVTPAHHFPHGVPLHPARRTAVVEWARRTGGYVIEDDYDGEFRYDRQPVGALQSLDPDRVVYLGSTSKSLTPGASARLDGAARPISSTPVVAGTGGQQWYVDGIVQLTMADFIGSGEL